MAWRLAAAALGFAVWAAGAPAQEAAPAAASAPAARPAVEDGDAAEDPRLTEDELDELVAPVALYPDALLAQVLVAATFPLEIVKAERWLGDNAALDGAARLDAAEAEGWDPSVAVLAGGFPTVIARMAEDLDWTESLGEALLVQSDDVLDAVQRQRARAAAAGALSSNEAQTVTVEDDAISIAPTDPEVVYVPSYDPALAYAPLPAGYVPPAAVAPATTVVEGEEGYSDGEVIAVGLLSFGAGMLVNEIFDDDDDDWGDWWDDDDDRPNIDWDDRDLYARPGRGDIDINGDVTFDRDGVDIDRAGAWRPDPARREEASARMTERRAARDGGAQPLRERAAARPQAERDAARENLSQRLEGRARDDGAGREALAARRGDAAGQARREGAGRTGVAGSREALSETRAARERGARSAGRAEGVRPNRDGARPNRDGARAASRDGERRARAEAARGGDRPALRPDRGGGGRASAQRERGQRSAERGGRAAGARGGGRRGNRG